MRVNPTDSIPAVAPESKSAERRVEPRPGETAVGHAAQSKPVPTDGTSVVVEIQRNNEAVYKFIDKSTGKLIEQIPSQQMLNFSNAIEKALPSLRKPESKK
jgi:hypothetical protein